MTNLTNGKLVKKTKDRYGCPAEIVHDHARKEWWWEMEGEVDGPFNSQEEAEKDLASR